MGLRSEFRVQLFFEALHKKWQDRTAYCAISCNFDLQTVLFVQSHFSRQDLNRLLLLCKNGEKRR